MAREKKGPCDAESTTRGADECLSRESKLTDSNYAAYTGAIRAIFALKAQIGPANVSGPTGTPLNSEEQQYRDIIPQTAHDQVKGGTLAPVFDGECTQPIVRSHMREFNQIYSGAFRL